MATSKTIITLMLITLVSVIGTGCSDDATSPAPVVEVVVDTAPPAAPANLALFMNTAGVVELSWDQNTTDADLDGFIVKREHLGQSVDLIGSPTNVASFYDYDVPTGISQYNVFSVDFTGNESAVVSVTYEGHQYHAVNDLTID